MKGILWLCLPALLLLSVAVPLQPLAGRGQTAPAGRQRPSIPIEQAAPAGGQSQPVYIYLYSRFTDHVNLELENARLHRVLPLLEKYRQEHPEAHVCGTVLFSGAMSRALAEHDAKTGTVKYIQDFARRGVIEIGYDGSDEPPSQKRPVADLSDVQIPEDRWLAREASAKELLTGWHDPLTGAAQPGAPGGLEPRHQRPRPKQRNVPSGLAPSRQHHAILPTPRPLSRAARARLLAA